MFLFLSQNPPVPPLSDPPQIYLTSVGDASSLTSLIPLAPVGGSVSPASPHLSTGPQGPQQDDCVGRGANPASFPPHPHPPPHPTHPSPVFVIINPPPSQQQQQTPVAAAPPSVAPPASIPPPSRPPPPPIVIKEENLPLEEELLEMVSLEEKHVEEVRGRDGLMSGGGGLLYCYSDLLPLSSPPGPSAQLWLGRTGAPPHHCGEPPPSLFGARG